MEHHFDVDIAKKYGMLEAVLLNNFYFWIRKNEANKVNEHDGYYWTYNSAKALHELFPYASERKIRTALNHLECDGLIISGNYNKSAYDRTMWYALTKNAICILQNRQMEDAEKENGNAENVTPIPDNNTDIKTDIEYIVEQYNLTSMPKCMKLTDSRKKKISKRVIDFGVDGVIQAFRKAEQSDFLSGRAGRWRCNLDWLIKCQDNMAKVLEGTYDNKKEYSREELELKRAYDSIRGGSYDNGLSFGE